MVRPSIPGDEQNARHGRENENNFLHRLHLGQIKTLNEEFGTLNVWVFDIQDFVTVEIPMPAMSVQRTSSSWFRYMPEPNSFVYIGYDLQNQPVCMGYALLGNDPSATASSSNSPTTGASPNQAKYVPHIGGYKRLALAKQASDRGQTEPAASTSSNQIPIGLRDFVPLKSGEWDIRSKGGAYIRGSRFGQLTLACASDYIQIDKQRDEIVSRAGLYKFSNRGNLTSNGISLDPTNPIDDTQARIGNVKRQLLPTDSNDAVPSGAGREWLLHVDQPLGVASTGFVYDERIGDIWSDGPVPIVDPLTRIKKELSVGPVTVFKFTVDALGNITVDNGPGTVTLNVTGGPGTTLATTMANTNITSEIATTIKSGGVTNVDGLTTLLGNAVLAASQPIPHGAVLSALLIELVTALTIFAEAKNPTETDPAYTALQVALAALAVQLALPPGPAPGPAGPLLSATVFGA